MSDAVTKQIEGVCAEISEKNGWTAFAIDVGSQYPIRLSTKQEDIIAQGRAAGTQKAVWTFKESESDKVNEHTGKPYVNRYLSSVEVGGKVELRDGDGSAHGPASTGGGQAGAVGTATVRTDWAEKDRQIVRQSCLKVAAQIVAAHGTNDGDFGSEVITLAARFETWVRRDVDDPPFE